MDIVSEAVGKVVRKNLRQLREAIQLRSCYAATRAEERQIFGVDFHVEHFDYDLNLLDSYKK